MSILIVEDSLTQAAQLRFILEENGFVVSVSENGEEALAYLEKERPAMVITDILMPKMDGYELCRKIREDEKLKDMPVILLTQLSEPEDIIKGLQCGANNFIQKPYDEEALISNINYIFANMGLRKRGASQFGIEIYFGGQKNLIDPDRLQILDLLFSSFENIIQQNKKLKEAIETIHTLRGLIPICSNCKKVRDDEGYWKQIEQYVKEHSEADFTHSICPQCNRSLYGGLLKNSGESAE